MTPPQTPSSLPESPLPPTAAVPDTFPEHFERASGALRGALVELLASVDARPDRPQQIARRFDLNKNLAWKMARLARATDPTDAAPHVPGPGGRRILLEAFERHAAPVERLAAVRRAFEGWDEMVSTHAGDRKGLDLLLASLHPDRVQRERLEAAHRLAFEGNSTICGVQARVRLGIQVVAPNAEDPDWVDIASLGGVLDFVRLRPTGRWPLVHFQTYGTEATYPGEPLDPASAERLGVPVLLDFCRGELPDLTVRDLGGGHRLYELGEGPVGQSAAVTCVFGSSHRRFGPVHGEQPGEVGEHFVRLDAPVERVLFDLLVHRDLPFLDPPGVTVQSLMQGSPRYPLVKHPEQALSVTADVQVLRGSPPVLATPEVPDLAAMSEVAARSIGRELEEFRAYRIELVYPPIPSMVSLHHALPERPGPSA